MTVRTTGIFSLQILLFAVQFISYEAFKLDEATLQRKGLHIDDETLQREVTKFWREDNGERAEDGQVQVDFQGPAGQHQDHAPKKFFKNVDKRVLQKPTYQALIGLFAAYDKYGADIKKFEPAVDAFFGNISATGPYKALQRALMDAGYEPAKDGDKAFQSALKEMWFGMYNRGRAGESSGFEHVFIGEHKSHEVIGLHNWVRMFWLESQDRLDYAGYLVKKNPRLPTIQFKVGSAWKNTGSLLIGTSPEFDFSVFTLCFVGGRGKCKFFLGDCTPAEVTSFPFDYDNHHYIGTTYPALWNTHDSCPIKKPH